VKNRTHAVALLALLVGGPAWSQPAPGGPPKRGGVEETTDRPALAPPAASTLRGAGPADPVDTAAPKITGPTEGVYGVRLKLVNVPRGSVPHWSISPQPPGLLWEKFTHETVFGGPAGDYHVTVDIETQRVGKLDKPLSEFKEGDVWPLTVSTVTVTFDFRLTNAPSPGPVPPGPGPTPVPPGPTPVPPGPVPPAPEPNPMPGVQGLHMLIVYESGDLGKYPAAQVNSWQSKAVFDYLAAKGKNWRVWDKDVDPSGDAPKWQAAFARAKGKTLPWIVVSNGTTGYEGPAPKDAAELLALLKRYGGD
jgi:hypothetical protein